MWHDEVLPRLQAIGLGADVAARTYRLMGIGESQVAELLGEPLLRTRNPEVATYARVEAVDVRVSAVGGADEHGTDRSADEWLAPAAAIVEDRLAAHIWATGETTWADAIGTRLGASSAGGSGSSRSGPAARSACCSAMSSGWRRTSPSPRRARRPAGGDDDQDAASEDALVALAERARTLGGAEVGLAVRTRERGSDTAVSVAVVTPGGVHRERRMAFLGGRNGRIAGGARRGERAVHGPARRGRRSGPDGRPDARQRRLASRGGDQPVEVGDDDALALEPEQAVIGELAQQLVHALTGAADHRREIGLGQVRPQPDPAVRRRRAAVLGEPDEPCRETPGDVQEVELFDVRRQSTQLARDGREQGVADPGLGRDELAEAIARQDDGLGRRSSPSRWPNGVRRRAAPAPRRRRRAGASRGSPRRRSRTAARS